MFDPANITLGQASSALRDFAVVFFLITVSWKSRALFEKIMRFFDRVQTHMDVMEHGMQTLLTNHLSHIETDLSKLAGRKPDLVQGDEGQ